MRLAKIYYGFAGLCALSGCFVASQSDALALRAIVAGLAPLIVGLTVEKLFQWIAYGQERTK